MWSSGWVQYWIVGFLTTKVSDHQSHLPERESSSEFFLTLQTSFGVRSSGIPKDVCGEANRNFALLHLRVLLLPFIVLLQNKRTTSHLLRMLKIYIKRPASNKRARAVNRINTVYYFQISRNHILSGAKKFLSFRSSLGNLSRFEITRDSVLFSRKF